MSVLESPFLEANDSYESLFERADQAMYRAKEIEGCNFKY